MFGLPGGWYLAPTLPSARRAGRARGSTRPAALRSLWCALGRIVRDGFWREENNNKDVFGVINSSCCLLWDGAFSPTRSSNVSVGRIKGGGKGGHGVGSGVLGGTGGGVGLGGLGWLCCSEAVLGLECGKGESGNQGGFLARLARE